MKKSIVLGAILTLIFLSCEYEFDSDNFIDIEEPLRQSEYIELLDFDNQDTINLERTMVYNFLGNDNQNTISSEVFLDNEKISSNWEGQSGTFNLRPRNYEDGIHTLKIEHVFTSGSGSIADQAAAEVIREFANYQFVVNRFPSTPPPVLSAEMVDGTIFVEWSTNFDDDYLNAYLNINFGSQDTQIPLTVSDLEMGVYNDTSTVLYQGNTNTPDYDQKSTVSYSILFESEYESQHGSSQSITYDPSMITVKTEFIDFESYKIKWTAHPQYANFENLVISYLGGQFTGSSQGDEYLVNTPYIIGQDYNVSMRPLGTGLFLPYYSYRGVPLESDTSENFDLDPLFIREILYEPFTNHFFALVIEDRIGSQYEFSIYEYSSEMEFIRKSNSITHNSVRYEYLDITLNPNDQNIYIDARGDAYKMDLTSLQIVDEFVDLPQTSELKYRGNILVSLNYDNDLLTVTNVASNTILYSDFSLSSGIDYLSPDGQYIKIRDNTGNFLYRIEGDQLVQIFDFSSTNLSGNMEIFNDQLFYATSNEIIIHNLLNNTDKSFDFGASQQKIQYDNFSGNLLVYQSDQSAIFNLFTEEIIRFQFEENKQTTGLFNQQDRDYFMRLWDNKLIHTKGILLNLD